MKKYGIMLIGCGHIGEEHISDIYYRDNIEIAAVVDSDIDRAELFARKYGAHAYGTDYRLFLTDDVDIVIIATYTDSHFAIVSDCVAKGKHILCEKPAAVDLKQAAALYKKIASAEVKIQIAHILRHNATYKKAAELIADGAVGDLRLMRMVQNHHAVNWQRYKRLLQDCPPIVDCGVHYIDVMQWFTGSAVTEIGGFSCKLDDDSPCDNYGVMNVKLANGTVGYYEVGWGKSLASSYIKEFVGTKGRLTLTLAENRFSNREEGDLITLYSSDSGEYKTINIQGKYKDMYSQLMSLINSVENNSETNPTADEAFASFYVTMLANKAIAEKTTLNVDYNEFLKMCNETE